MHFNDNQTLRLRSLIQLQMTVFGRLVMTGATVVVMVVWRQNAEAKMKVLGHHPIWVHRKATTFNGVGTSTTSGKLKSPMAIRLQESDMVIPECVYSHETPENTHPFYFLKHVKQSWE